MLLQADWKSHTLQEMNVLAETEPLFYTENVTIFSSTFHNETKE